MPSRLDNQDSCSGFDSPAALLDGHFEQPTGERRNLSQAELAPSMLG